MQRAGESRLDPARVVGVQLPLSAGHVGFAVADGHDSDDASTEGELDRVRQLGDGHSKIPRETRGRVLGVSKREQTDRWHRRRVDQERGAILITGAIKHLHDCG